MTKKKKKVKFKAGAELGKVIGSASAKGTFGVDLKSTTSKKKKKSGFKSGADLSSKI